MPPSAQRLTVDQSRARAAAIVAAMLAVLVLVLCDVFGAAQRPPGLGSAWGTLLFTLFGWALGSAVFVPFLLLRERAHATLIDAAPAASAFVGALEGLVFFGLAIIGQDPRSPAGDARVLALIGICLAWGGALWLWARWGIRERRAWRAAGPLVVAIAATGIARSTCSAAAIATRATPRCIRVRAPVGQVAAAMVAGSLARLRPRRNPWGQTQRHRW